MSSSVPELRCYPSPPKPTPKTTTNRLRSACDSCHQAKTRCSGTSPCLSCQMSATPCTYSPCNRPGRPKGSRNKRSDIDVNEHRGDVLEACSLRPSPSLGLRPPPHTLWDEPFDFSLTPLLQEQQPLGEELRIPASSDENDTDLFMHSFADFIPSQPPLHAPSSAPADSPCESGYATATASVPTDDLADADGDGPCSCLRRHIHLVYQLGDLQSAPAGKVSSSAVLEGVRRAQRPWSRIQECRQCRGPECPQEVLLLFAVSVRILLSSFQQLHLWDPEGGKRTVSESASRLDADTDVVVGTFEVTGAVKAEVVNLILRNALEQVLSALLYLQSRDRQLWASLLESASRASRSSSADTPRRSGLDEAGLLPGMQSLPEDSRPGSKRART